MRKILLLSGIIMCVNVAVYAQQHTHIDLSQPAPSLTDNRPATLLAPDAATCGYGFFCRQELKRDKVLPMPVRFRVGSMQQNDWLERKPNATAPVR